MEGGIFRRVSIAAAFGVGVLTSVANAGLFGPSEKHGDWEKDDCTKYHSFAWCVVNNGLRGADNALADAQLTDEQKKLLDTAPLVDGTLGVAAVGATTAHPVPILPRGLSAGSFLFFASGMDKWVAQSNLNRTRMYWYVPANLTPKEAADQVSAQIEAALKTVLEPTDLHIADDPRAESHKTFLYTSPKCPAPACTFFDNDDDITKLDQEMAKVTMPKFLGEGDAYLGKMWFGYGKSDEKKSRHFAFTREETFALSRALPANFYIYLPPHAYQKDAPPVLLNQGHAHYFVVPN